MPDKTSWDDGEATEPIPAGLPAARVLFYLNTVIWIMLGMMSLVHIFEEAHPAAWEWLIAVLMFANAMIMLGFGLLLRTMNRWVIYGALAFLAVNMILSLTDQFGFYDLLTLVIDALLVILLVGLVSKTNPGRS